MGRMNKLDHMIATVAPQLALKRMTARRKMSILNSGYSHHGASRTKKSFLGWMFGGGSPKEDITDNLDTLRQRSRDLYMGAASLATGALKTMRTNVVGTGLRLKPALDVDFLGLNEEKATQLKRTIEREFRLWADSTFCDSQRLNNFYDLQQLAFLSQLLSGDCFVLLPMIPHQHSVYDLRIRVLEADRCCDPMMKHDKDIQGGVEVDSYGAVIAYHFSDQHPLGAQTARREWSRVEAIGEKTGRRNVLHLMESERPEQRRGVPILAPVIESLKQLGRYTEAELMAAVVAGIFTVFVKTDSGTPVGEWDGYELDDVSDDVPNDMDYKLGNGSIVELAKGESIETANPQRPNAQFDGFVTAILRQVGSALELPYELLVKHFTASYSASRAALLEAWKMFRMRRAWLAEDFCQPVYEEWFTEAVAKGRIHAPGYFSDPLVRKAYTQAEWHGPSSGQIDPLKEAKAAQLRVQEGFSTRERETVELTGGDFEINHRQRVREEQMRREGGLIYVEPTKADEVLDDDEERAEQ